MDKLLKPKIGVGVYVLQNDQILLGQRIASHGQGTWCSPGGHLEFGETPIECAKRELYEETGLIAKNTIIGPWTNEIFQEENKHYVTLNIFVTEFEGQPKVREPEKMVNWQWFSKAHLPSPLFLSMENFLQSYEFPCAT